MITKLIPKNNPQDKDIGFEAEENLDKWVQTEEEGQLSVDVYEKKDKLVIKSTIAGVKPEDLDISIDNDMVTIRGRRQEDEIERDRDYYHQECYWGSFSRTIILPTHVKGDEAEAIIKNGVLTITIPKLQKSTKIDVKEVNG